MIEIHQPEIEALIHQRLASGAFENVEDVLLQALRNAPLPKNGDQTVAPRTGADLIAAMQAMPYKDVNFEFERAPMPVREIEL